MSKEQAEMKIKAAAYAAAAEIGWREAVDLLKAVAREIEDIQWKN